MRDHVLRAAGRLIRDRGVCFVHTSSPRILSSVALAGGTRFCRSAAHAMRPACKRSIGVAVTSREAGHQIAGPALATYHWGAVTRCDREAMRGAGGTKECTALINDTSLSGLV